MSEWFSNILKNIKSVFAWVIINIASLFWKVFIINYFCKLRTRTLSKWKINSVIASKMINIVNKPSQEIYLLCKMTSHVLYI